MPALDVSQTESHLYCVLVALSLTGLARRMSLIVLYYNSDLMGEMRPESVVIMTSEIYAIFYGTKTQGIVF